MTDDVAARRGSDRPGPLLVVAILGVLAASRFAALRATPWEIDEAVFAGAVVHFSVPDLSPHFPGFPAWILIGRLLAPFTGDPFRALAVASTILAGLLPAALFTWLRSMGAAWEGLTAAVVYSFVPVTWYFGGSAFSETPSTAFFVAALALLGTAAAADRRRSWLLLGGTGGVLAAAGLGIRPHHAILFGPLLAVELVLLARKGRRDGAFAAAAAALVVLAGLATFLAVSPGGLPGLLEGFLERWSYRSDALAVSQMGSVGESLLVRDLLSPVSAAIFWGLAVCGTAASVVLGPASLGRRVALLGTLGFASFWVLHSREMPRYSIPLVLAGSVGAGIALQRLTSRRLLGLGLACLLSLANARAVFPSLTAPREGASPAIAALREIERTDAGNSVIVAGEAFLRFLETQTRLGRLHVPFLLEDELLEGVRIPSGRSVIRLVDATEPRPLAADRGPWHVRGERDPVATALMNARLLSVGWRDPAPPLPGLGFGVLEKPPDATPFRWMGPDAEVLIPDPEPGRVLLLSGRRFATAGNTTLVARDGPGGPVLLRRALTPGPFLVLVPHPVRSRVKGSLNRIVFSCDAPEPLELLLRGTRPLQGCAVAETLSDVAGSVLWERPADDEALADLGTPRDELLDPVGFHVREAEKGGQDFRWASPRVSVLWCPLEGFRPTTMRIRWRAPGDQPVRCTVAFGDTAEVPVEAPGGRFLETEVHLSSESSDALSSGGATRIEVACPVYTAPGDSRLLGAVIDRIRLLSGV